MTKDNLKNRSKQFALRILKLIGAIPKGRSENAIPDRLVRSGTSAGSNYRAACRSRSRAEFIAKIGVVEEETDKSAFWLEFISEHGLHKRGLITRLHEEADELTAIMAASESPPLGIPHSVIRQAAFGTRQSHE
jgi:four helix bundle protein